MIKSFCSTNMHILLNLFNIVFQSDAIPSDWGIGLIKPIYKNKGNINDPINYRGITLLSCIDQLFTSILNARLSLFVISNGTLSDTQAGFRKGYSTIDHIYTLKCIVDSFLCQGRRRMFLCAFVDYSKAFDLVNRLRLWTKLLQFGITGKLFRVAQNIYKSIKSLMVFHRFI